MDLNDVMLLIMHTLLNIIISVMCVLCHCDKKL